MSYVVAGTNPERLQIGLNPDKAQIMNSVIVEIRAAEGGDDAKILVGYQTEIYAKVARRHCL